MMNNNINRRGVLQNALSFLALFAISFTFFACSGGDSGSDPNVIDTGKEACLENPLDPACVVVTPSSSSSVKQPQKNPSSSSQGDINPPDPQVETARCLHQSTEVSDCEGLGNNNCNVFEQNAKVFTDAEVGNDPIYGTNTLYIKLNSGEIVKIDPDYMRETMGDYIYGQSVGKPMAVGEGQVALFKRTNTYGPNTRFFMKNLKASCSDELVIE